MWKLLVLPALIAAVLIHTGCERERSVAPDNQATPAALEPELMARVLPKLDGVFIQAVSEVAAVGSTTVPSTSQYVPSSSKSLGMRFWSTVTSHVLEPAVMVNGASVARLGQANQVAET